MTIHLNITRQWNKEFFPLKIWTFLFHLNTTESSFCCEFRYQTKRLEWMCKRGTSLRKNWQMSTFQATFPPCTCVNAHLHRSHSLWLATQVVRNNNNHFTLHSRLSMLFLLFYYVTFDYRALFFINLQLLTANTSERAA